MWIISSELITVSNLTSNGTVSISHVDSDYTPGGGILIDNSMASTAKNVTLLDIDANDNSGQYGIQVISKGVISVKDIDLEGNDVRLFGMVLDNSASTTKAGVILGSTYINEITNFVNNGLFILTNGSVTIDRFYLSDTSDGIIVDNTSGGTGTGAVSISNSEVHNSEDDGINISTNGNVTLTNVMLTITGRTVRGWGSTSMSTETASDYSGTVTMTNIVTSYNYGDGLYVEAWKNITLKNFYAENNYNSGRGAYLATDGGVSLLNPGGTTWNYLYNNAGSNLVINALGDVTVQKLYTYSSDNGYGLLIDTAGKVTLTTVEAQSNILDGLRVTAGGSITASGLLAQYNQLHGAVLDNHLGSGGVTVKSSTIYYNYADSPEGGLIINTNGVVLLDKVTADSNEGYGAVVTISAPSTASVTVNKSQFSYNGDDGLHVVSQGIVTLNGITANYNYNLDTCGVNIDNTAGTGNVNVLATLGANIFHDNNTHGLLINTSGAVIINNATAYLNSNGVGIGVLNNTGTGSVTITGAVVKDNRMPGIAITTNGTVTLSNIEAIANGVYDDFSGIDIQTSGDAVLIQNSVISATARTASTPTWAA